MLAHRLQRLQSELQCHRCWLSGFQRQTRAFSRIDGPGRLSLVHRSEPRRPLPFQHGFLTPVPGTIAFASNKVRRQQIRKAKGQFRLDLKGEREAEDLDRALKRSDFQDVVEAYHGLENKSSLRHSDTNKIVQCLHQNLRSAKWESDETKRSQVVQEIIEFVEALVRDIKSGTLTPSPRAHMHLLGIFKESGARGAGVKFWTWLLGQDERFVDTDVYGAAIELLAVQGTPLPDLEELYEQALSRFPSTFAPYHLSPNAVLEDRERATTLQRMPIVLLQGILTARLLNGDTRNAYLALDTALRLYPDQLPARFFTLFSEERPVVEAYTVFAIAWRAGISIPQGHLKYQLSALRSNSDAISVKRHPMALRAMLSALYMHMGTRGTITQNSINELIIAMTQFLRMDVISSLAPKDKQKVVRGVMDIIRKGLAVFARNGARPGLPAFNSIIINLGGYGHSKQTIGVALSDARALGLEPNDITRRSIMIAAGLMSDEDLLKKAWQTNLEARVDAGEMPDSTDFHCLVKASHLTGQIDFAREEFEKFKDKLMPHEQEIVSNGLDNGNMYNLGVADGKEQADVSFLLGEIEKISADLDVIEERTKETGTMQDYSEQKLPMRLLVDDEVSLPEADMKMIYDELSTEQQPSQTVEVESVDAAHETADSSDHTGSSALAEPEIKADSAPAITPTNIPFSTIRYENWKLINWLLEQSESNDKAYRDAVERAISNGIAPPHRSKGLGPSLKLREVVSFGLSDLVDTAKKPPKERSATEAEVRMAREHILKLRGRL